MFRVLQQDVRENLMVECIIGPHSRDAILKKHVISFTPRQDPS